MKNHFAFIFLSFRCRCKLPKSFNNRVLNCPLPMLCYGKSYVFSIVSVVRPGLPRGTVPGGGGCGEARPGGPRQRGDQQPAPPGGAQYSTVQYSNLHRQVAHSEARLGVNKAASLATTLATLNSGVEAVPHPLLLDSASALAIIRQYDIVLDCTDNVATRWTILYFL